MSKILVADDDYLMTWSISRALAREGYQVRCVDSLDGAQKATEQDDFDLVISDLMFPEGQALTFLGHLGRSSRPVPVILMTAHGCSELEAQALASGVQAYLEKPFSMDELRSLVRHALTPSPPAHPADLEAPPRQRMN